MSNYSQVRTFFNQIIKDSGPFREWKDAFNFENIPNNIIDRSYHLEIESIQSQAQNDATSDENMSVTLRVFFKGLREVQPQLDKAFDECFVIKTNLIRRPNFIGQANIKSVIFNSLAPSFPTSNDNLILMTFNFTVRLFYRAC